MNREYNITTLANGLRIVSKPTLAKVSYIGLAVNAGSRDEDDSRQGLAHFLEHTIFKGTDKRRCSHISSRMESVGGELNAYTSKEETLIYTNAPDGYAERAIELLSDLVANSRFPQNEIDREREVVIEEINSYLDSPSDSVYDDFEDLIYAGSGLAHNILGTSKSVCSLRPTDCREFLDTYYTPENMVLYCSDSSTPDKIVRLAEKYFGHLHHPKPEHKRVTPGPRVPFHEMRDDDNHQANTVIGLRTFGRTDSRRYALYLLNNYLGGPCMNSRLNHELRDARGLVYTVDSNVSLLSDTGCLTIYYGCDKENNMKCRKLVEKELRRIAEEGVTPRKLEQMKTQYCGQLLVSSDHRESRAMSMGKSILYYGEVIDIDVATRLVQEVTIDEIRDVAAMLHPDNTSSLTLL